MNATANPLASGRYGDWIQTYSGRVFYPMDPRPDEIHIEDVAHALSMMCRYAGHCIRFYSVAEHSVLLSHVVPQEDALWALLHDATEAYLVDVPRPVKPFLAGYAEAEAKLHAAVAQRFQLPREIPQTVHDADYRICHDESWQNMCVMEPGWVRKDLRLGVKLHYWDPQEAERQFHLRFLELTQDRPS